MPVEIRFSWGRPILERIQQRTQWLRQPFGGLVDPPSSSQGANSTRSRLRSLPWQGLVLLGLASGSGFWLPILMPSPAQAYTARMAITLDRQPDESYDTLLRRAEAAARAAAQRGFDRDVLVSELSIIVMAQNRGLTAPILALQVSRTQWRNRPDAGFWITYFRTARELLGFSRRPTTPAPSGTTGTTPTPAAPPTSTVPTPPGTPAPTTPPATTPVSPPVPTPVTTPVTPPATTPPSTPAIPPAPAARPTPPETEAGPTPSNQPRPRPLVIPAGSGVPRIPTLPSP
ncbi:hypothetical protein OOK60_00760 [Trichothermofontia sichuanensis B231]|uniref:hypothetical protein n=1 Tax=Trichothermofontia sichuanensis TaxID=3045816 RepID=UPI0022461AB8|nr:hypothetical protein [Trichothermofontia sichuanensis]UZQ54641.1 hypothetical protein OOK60_00760 [Trichothermofontia sichuanensis B231]